MIDYPADFDWDNPAQHWQRAKRLMRRAAELDGSIFGGSESADSVFVGSEEADRLVAQAQVHATMALKTDRLATILDSGRGQRTAQRARQAAEGPGY